MIIDSLKNRITLGSLFDGIGGFPYAASFFGIETLWASEIIPTSISVTQRHFPYIKHLGDITKINGGEIVPVDIITFGSPCQSFSIAGQRQGLEGKSGLFWEAIRIIREMREATNGEYPRYCVFENVPGILSANKGRDYKTVLEAFTETEIPLPPSGKWTSAGMVRGGRIDFAWVIHDAQYFGVAQRRRRLFAVCDFTGQRAAEILFKPKSLCGYFTQSGETRESLAGNAAESVRGTGLSACTAVLNDQGGESLTVEKKEISPTLRSEAHGNLPIVTMQITDEDSTEHENIGINGNTSATLDSNYHKGTGNRGGIEREVVLCRATGQSNSETLIDKSATLNCNCEQPIICMATTQLNAECCNNLCPTITEAAGKSGNNKPYIVMEIDEAYPINTQIAVRHNALGKGTGFGIGKNGDPAYTLLENHSHAVAVLNADAYGFDLQQITSKTNRSQLKEVQPVLCKAGRPHCVIRKAYTGSSFGGMTEGVGTLRAAGGDNGGGSESLIVSPPPPRFIVRRLTPIECERLQGFPDGWTEYGHDGKPLCDTARYQALGNAVAIPCVFYVLSGIVDEFDSRKNREVS